MRMTPATLPRTSPPLRTAGFCALAAGFLALAGTPAQAERSERFVGDFSAEHNATSTPTGHVDALYFPSTHQLRYTITWQGLTGPVTVAHLHGPATPDQEAPHLVTIKGPYTTPLNGTMILSADGEKALLEGKTYINLHTQAYPKGEARAQLLSPYKK